MKRILIVGSESKLAARFVSHCALLSEWEIAQTSRQNVEHHFLDLADSHMIAPELLAMRFDFCLVFAAMSNIADCEQTPQVAIHINAIAIENLINKLHVRNWILFSTNQVYSGTVARVTKETEQDANSVYGKSKALMESVALTTSASVAIVRLTKVIDNQFPLFERFIEHISNGQKVSAYSDMVFAPINSKRVCQFLVNLVDRFKPGVYQLSASNDLSYYAALVCVASLLKLPLNLISPQSAPQVCPKNTTLMVDKLEQDYGFYAQSTEETLREVYLQQNLL